MSKDIWAEGFFSPFSVLVSLEGKKNLFVYWVPEGIFLTPVTLEAQYGYGAPRRAIDTGALINAPKGTILTEDKISNYYGYVEPCYNQVLLNRYENNNYKDKSYMDDSGNVKLTDIEFRRLPTVLDQFPEEEPEPTPPDPEEEPEPPKTTVYYLPAVPEYVLDVEAQETVSVAFEQADQLEPGLHGRNTWKVTKPFDQNETPSVDWHAHWPEELLYRAKEEEHHYQLFNAARLEFGESEEAQVPLIRELRGLADPTLMTSVEIKKSSVPLLEHASWNFRDAFRKPAMRVSATMRSDVVADRENIAYTADPPSIEKTGEMFQLWMDSPDHRPNILAENGWDIVWYTNSFGPFSLAGYRGENQDAVMFEDENGDEVIYSVNLYTETMSPNGRTIFHGGDVGQDTIVGKASWSAFGQPNYFFSPNRVGPLTQDIWVKGFNYLLTTVSSSGETFVPDSNIVPLGVTVVDDEEKGKILSVFTYRYEGDPSLGTLNPAVWVESRPLRSIPNYDTDSIEDPEDAKTLDSTSFAYMRWESIEKVIEFDLGLFSYPASRMSFTSDGKKGLLSMVVQRRTQYETFYDREGQSQYGPDLDMDEAHMTNVVFEFEYDSVSHSWSHDKPFVAGNAYTDISEVDRIDGHNCFYNYAVDPNDTNDIDMHRMECIGETEYLPIYVNDQIEYHKLITDTVFLVRSTDYSKDNPEFWWDNGRPGGGSWLSTYFRVVESLELPSGYVFPIVNLDIEPIPEDATYDLYKFVEGSFFTACLHYIPEQDMIFYLRFDLTDNGNGTNVWGDRIVATDVAISLWVNDTKIADIATITDHEWGELNGSGRLYRDTFPIDRSGSSTPSGYHEGRWGIFRQFRVLSHYKLATVGDRFTCPPAGNQQPHDYFSKSQHRDAGGNIVESLNGDANRRVFIGMHPCNLEMRSLDETELKLGNRPYYNGNAETSDRDITRLGYTPGVRSLSGYFYGTGEPPYELGVKQLHFSAAVYDGKWVAQLDLGYIVGIDLATVVGKDQMVFSNFDDLEALLGVTDLVSVFPLGVH